MLSPLEVALCSEMKGTAAEPLLVAVGETVVGRMAVVHFAASGVVVVHIFGVVACYLGWTHLDYIGLDMYLPVGLVRIVLPFVAPAQPFVVHAQH